MKHHRKSPIFQDPYTPSEPDDAECAPTPTVTSIGDWKKRKPTPRIITRSLTRSQRQAALLRLLLCDEITDTDLDAILQAALSILASSHSNKS